MDIDDFFARHELRDPQALLDEIATAFPLTEGRVLLALVHQPARQQRLLAVDELSPLPPDIDEEHRGRSDLRTRWVETGAIWATGVRSTF